MRGPVVEEDHLPAFRLDRDRGTPPTGQGATPLERSRSSLRPFGKPLR